MVCVPISKIVYPGKSLGYFEGKAIFTDEGLPGEVVEVEPQKIKKNYLEGITRAILQASPQRRQPRCGHYRACSSYQIMEYAFQLEIKQEQLREIFRRQLQFDLPSLTVVPSPLIWEYRNRARFHLIWLKDAPVLAYHQPGQLTRFMAVDKCYLLPEKANRVLEQTLEILQIENLRVIREIEVRYSFTTDDCLIIFFLEEASTNQTLSFPSNKDFPLLKDLSEISFSGEAETAFCFPFKKTHFSLEEEKGFCNLPSPEKKETCFSRLDFKNSFSNRDIPQNKINSQKGGHRIKMTQLYDFLDRLRKNLNRLSVAGAVAIIRKEGKEEEHLLSGQPWLQENIEGKSYTLGTRTFFQVNVPILSQLIKDLKAIIPLSGQEKLADLYCGVGTFGLALASQVAEVYGVEILPENIALLRKNLEENKIENFKVMAGSASQWTPKILSSGPDLVIVDPPRRGLEKMVVKSLIDCPCRYLIYLSCNPATLARDLKELLKVYELKEVRFYDFFPQTPHIETLTILEGKPRRG